MSSKTLCLSVPPSILGHECVSGKTCEVMVTVGGGVGGGVGVYLQWTGFPSREHSCTPGGANRSDEGLTLETSAFLLFTVANLRFQPSC